MPIDALLKKFYLPVLVALLGLSAYWQASGVTELMSASLLPPNEEELVGAIKRAPPVKPTVKADKRRTATAIIERNPFDSVTGPLNAKPPELPDPDEEKKAPKLDTSDPLNAEPCPGLEVNIVTESPDPVWSLAHIKSASEPKGMIRRVGDPIDAFEVAFIGYNPVKASPAVWLVNESKLCQALLFGEEATPEPKKSAPPRRKAAPKEEEKKPAANRPRRGADKVPQELADKINKVTDTEFNIDRSVVDNVLENQAQLMRSARIVPEQKDGKVVGIRLFGIRPDTLLGTLGLQNGDRLEQINGFDMGSPEKALEAYARLRTADKLTVNITRRGKPMTLDFNIK